MVSSPTCFSLFPVSETVAEMGSDRSLSFVGVGRWGKGRGKEKGRSRLVSSQQRLRFNRDTQKRHPDPTPK